jgi:hypothetical protein
MNNYTERTWTLVTINEAVREKMKSYVDHPPRKLQSEVYTGPITLAQFERLKSVARPSRRKASASRFRRATDERTMAERTRGHALLAVVVAAAAALCAPVGAAEPTAGGAPQAKATSPLPSWNDGPARTRIIAFVEAVTDPGGKDFVPVEEASPSSTTTARCGRRSRSTSSSSTPSTT